MAGTMQASGQVAIDLHATVKHPEHDDSGPVGDEVRNPVMPIRHLIHVTVDNPFTPLTTMRVLAEDLVIRPVEVA